MAAAAGYYFVGADAKLWVQNSSVSGAPTDSDLVAVVRGWNFAFKWDTKPLYAMDSIMFLVNARTKGRVEGSIKYAKFDPASGWFANAVDTTDTSVISTFTITGEVKPATGSDAGALDIDAKIEGARFSQITFNVPEFDWVTLEMPFVGAYLTLGGVTIA